MSSKMRETVWGLGSAVLIVIGSLGPWAKIGPFTVSGTDGDGVITLVLGVVAVAVVLADRWPGVTFAAAVAAALVGIYDTVNVSSSGNDLISPNAGWGVIVVAIAGVSLTAWAALAVARWYRAPA